MRVLVLSADYPPATWSGIGTAAALQAAAVARQGVEVSVLLPSDLALTPERFPLRADDFDVIHLHSLGLSELALQLQSRFGVPLVYTAHASLDDELPGFSHSSGWGAAQDLIFDRSDHVLFPSLDEREAAVSRHADLERRSSVHPNGVMPSSARSTQTSRTGPVVFAGRFAETKGLQLLSDIVELLDGHPAIRFVLAGGHGDPAGERAVAELLSRHPDRCRAVGWLDQTALERLFARASMVLVPSRYEPFGLVALEAMSAGTPVLAAPVGGLREIVCPDSGGILMDSRRPRDWCATILRVWESQELRSALAQAGPSYVAKRFNPDTLARLLVDDVYVPLSTRRAAVWRQPAGAGVR